MIQYLRTRFAILRNRFRRRNGPSLQDQCAQLIMGTCSLQLERTEVARLAPVKGAFGPMILSGGAITTITYRVFDRNADRVDKTIRDEPLRAMAQVTMRVSIQQDPEFEVAIDGHPVEPKSIHMAPGLSLIAHLAAYFPLLPKPFAGPTIKPEIL